MVIKIFFIFWGYKVCVNFWKVYEDVFVGILGDVILVVVIFLGKKLVWYFLKLSFGDFYIEELFWKLLKFVFVVLWYIFRDDVVYYVELVIYVM